MPATNAWLRSRFLSSPGWRRIRSRQTSRVSAGSSASGPCSGSPRPGTGRSTPAGTEVDLAHLGRVAIADLGVGVVGGQPGRAAGPCERRRPAAPSRGAEARARRRSWPAACRPGAASWKRPVSIGLQAISSRSRSISRNLPRRRIDSTRWPTSAASSAGVPRTASGPGASADRTGRPASAAWRASATTVRSGNSGTARRL